MADQFEFDVFLSHSSKDKAVVRDLAVRLKNDGLRIWFDEWEVKPGDSSPKKIETGLEQSRTLVLCMSANAFGADWAGLEDNTFRFRDPLSQERRFIPLRLDDTPTKAALAQFLCLDWNVEKRAESYPTLLSACRPLPAVDLSEREAASTEFKTRIYSLGHSDSVNSVAWSPDCLQALSGSSDQTVRLWDLVSARCIAVLEGHTATVHSVAWSPDGRQALSCSGDMMIRLWDVGIARCLTLLEGHSDAVLSVAWSPDGRQALSASCDRTVRLWDVGSGRCLSTMEGHTDAVLSVAWSPDARQAISAAKDQTVRLWDVASGRCLSAMEGHSDAVLSVAWCPDGQRAISGSHDQTARVWDVASGRCLAVLDDHRDTVMSVAWSPDGQKVLTGAYDRTVRVWGMDNGRCLATLEGHSNVVLSVAWSSDGRQALSGSEDKTLRVWDVASGRCLSVLQAHKSSVYCVDWSADGRQVLSGSDDNTVRVWCHVADGHRLAVLEGHTATVRSVAWSPDGRKALSGSYDKTLRVWDVASGRCLAVLEGHTNAVRIAAWSPNGRQALSGSYDKTLRVWDVTRGRCLAVLEEHSAAVTCMAWSPDGRLALSGSDDRTLRVWDVVSGRCQSTLEGHTDAVISVAWSPDGRLGLSGSCDRTVRVWDLASGRCLAVLEGHTNIVMSVAWSPDSQQSLSAAKDQTVRVWDVASSRCQSVVKGPADVVISVVWSSDGRRTISGAADGAWRSWNLPGEFTADSGNGPVGSGIDSQLLGSPKQVRYTNAKVLLVGDSGVGKTGLANRLAHARYQDTDSTDGAWATHWKLPHSIADDGVDREIWLWDFAGQVDYRLVHQLFMEETAAAVLVFNPQQENLFDGLDQWDRDLQKATRNPFAKLLAAGRVDRGGLVVSPSSIERFMQERGFRPPLHLTSAKGGEGAEELCRSIVEAIDWQRIPATTSPQRYWRMKQEILTLHDDGLVLLRLAELKQRMELALSDERFELSELETVISLLTGPGMIHRLGFGGFILLRPDILSRYAAAVVRQVRKHPQQLGCIRESDLLMGHLDFQDLQRLPPEDESVILRALLEILISRAWCLRQPDGDSHQLIFPSYYLRKRPVKPGHPQPFVTYRFSGSVDEIYATLVVRLHHTDAFETAQLWKDAADFKTQMGKMLGVQLVREAEGQSRLEIYFGPEVEEDTRALLLRYVQDHLVAAAIDVVRLRHYFCGNKKCDVYGQPFESRALIDAALRPNGKRKVFCPCCGKEIPLRDAIEDKFDSPEIKEVVRELRSESDFIIDNECRELLLVGHAQAIAAEAGQIYRGYTNSDHGIDAEIEFKDGDGKATGIRLYLQLKSGDSHLKARKKDGVEIFQIKNERWAEYWQQHSYPVMLVIRKSDGIIRWMDVSEYLRRESNRGPRTIRQIEFDGERMDAYAIRRMRDRLMKTSESARAQ